jgi:hypothetical protein
MDLTNCPWAPLGQIPVHYCETNLCTWVVQPANTWSNIGYLIASILIFRQKSWSPIRTWIALVVLFLFLGSTFYHMSGTYIGRDFDVGGMLLLSAFVLGQTLSRSYNIAPKKTFFLTVGIFLISVPTLHGWIIPGGGAMFVLQIVLTSLLELIYSRKNPVSASVIKSLALAVGLFFFALILNLLDMNRIYCLPDNNVVTLHAIWHLICAYSIYLGAKYYCHMDSVASSST